MNSRMKSIAKWIGWIIVSLVGSLLLIVIVTSIIYSPEYVFIVLRWDDSDVYDFQKFPERGMDASPEPFHFNKNLDVTRVQEYFESHPMVNDLDNFLQDTNTQALIDIQDDAVLYENYQTGAQRDSIVLPFQWLNHSPPL